MPDRDAYSSLRFARQTVAERALSKMPEHFYTAAEVRVSSIGSWYRSQSNHPAGVPLRIGKAGRPPANRISTGNVGGNRRQKANAGCRARAFECKSKTAREARTVRRYA